VGDTDLEVTPETSPTPLSMLTLVAPEMLQDRVALCPAAIVAGVAVNEVMVGTEPVPPEVTGVSIVMTSLGIPPTEFRPQIFWEDTP